MGVGGMCMYACTGLVRCWCLKEGSPSHRIPSQPQLPASFSPRRIAFLTYLTIADLERDDEELLLHHVLRRELVPQVRPHRGEVALVFPLCACIGGGGWGGMISLGISPVRTSVVGGGKVVWDKLISVGISPVRTSVVVGWDD